MQAMGRLSSHTGAQVSATCENTLFCLFSVNQKFLNLVLIQTLEQKLDGKQHKMCVSKT